MKGSIRKVPRETSKDKWRVQIYLPDGSRRTKVFDTKTKAERWKSKMNQRYYEEGTLVDPSDQPLSEFLQGWLRDYAKHNVKESTYSRYESLIRCHITEKMGDLPLNNITTRALQKFYTYKLNKGRKDGQDGGLSKRTVVQMHRILHKAFKWAVKMGEMQKNPASQAQPPKPEEKEKETLNYEQVQKMFKVAEEQTGYTPALYDVAAKLGMRRGEILGLRWKDLDFDNQKLSIVQTYIKKNNGELIFDRPKSDKSRRNLRVPKGVIETLKEHREQQEDLKDKLGNGWQGDGKDLVFTANNGKPIRPRNLHRDFKEILSEAGLPDIPFHNLRHTTATLLLENGVGMEVVQSILGHKTITTTVDTYSNISDERQEQALEDLDNSISDSDESQAQAG